MQEELRNQIEHIISEMHCPKNFRCSESAFKDLCKARDFGLDHYLECLEDQPPVCKFSFSFGNDYICECPLRVYILKKLHK